MSINLSDFERGAPFAGDYHATLSALQDRLARLQLAQIVHRKRAIVLFEGWGGSGKKEAVKCLVGSWDPCHVTTHCCGFEGHGGDERHWLARYWSQLPAAGETTIFFRSWYAQMIEALVAGDLGQKEFARATDEINEFESQQCDHGTLIVKLFFHISTDTQAQRLRAQREDPWRRWLLHPEASRALMVEKEPMGAVHQAFAATNTRWAPWKVIDANDPQSGRIAALTALADALEKAIPKDPPVEGSNVVSFRPQRQA